MIDHTTQNILNIGEKHETALLDTLRDLAPYYPFSEQFIINLDVANFRTLETMTNRFSKLQDLLGSKIFDFYLISVSENIDGLSMLDKIHKLEKLNMLESEEIWQQLRDVRNHAAHEYPDQPLLTAQHLNSIYEFAPLLIEIFQKFATSIRN